MSEPDAIDPAFADRIIKTVTHFSRLQMKTAWTLLPKGQFFILRIIDHHAGDFTDGVPVSLIADHLHSSKPAVSRMLGSLEDQGLIKRTPSPEDRRAALVSMTDKGREVHDRAADLYREYLAIVTSTFGEERMEHLMNELSAYTDISSAAFEEMKNRYPKLHDAKRPPMPPFSCADDEQGDPLGQPRAQADRPRPRHGEDR